MGNRWSLYANSVEEAVTRALKESGPETLLVSSKRAHQHQAHLGMYEVVFELEDDSVAAPAPAPEPTPIVPIAAEVRATPAPHRGERQLLRSLLSEIRQARRTLGAIDGTEPASVSALGAQRVLRSMGFSDEAAASLTQDDQSGLERAGRAVSNRSALAASLATRIHVDSTPAVATKKRSVVALVGPAGSGKTTTLVKLAVRYGLMAHRPTLLIGGDTNRLAACDQLQSYASALGVSYAQAESPTALFALIDEHRSKELILIDVPGISPREPELVDEWASVLSRPEFDVHLVLQATTRFEELNCAYRRFQPMNPRHLVFTHLDEITHGGGMLSLALQTQIPVSFLCTGQGVPEDIEPASNSALARLFEPEQLAAAAAA